MELLREVAKVLLVASVCYLVALPLINKRRRVLSIWRLVWGRTTLRIVASCVAMLVCVLTVGGLLYALVPFTRHGWLYLVMGADNNMVLATVVYGTTSGYKVVQLLPVVFLVVLMTCMPYLAKSEEEFFRKDREEWGQIIRASLVFGPLHCIAGVPLAAGLALIVAGLFYGHRYKHTYDKLVPLVGHRNAQNEAVLVSTTYHAVANNLLMLICLVAVTIGLFL